MAARKAPKQAPKKRKPSFDLPAGEPSGADTGWVYRTDAGRGPRRPAAAERSGGPTPADRVVAWVSAPFAMVVLLALVPLGSRR